MRRVAWSAALLAAGADTATTWYGITALGMVEANPVVAAVMGSVGLLPAMLALKAVVLLIAALVEWRIGENGWVAPLAVSVPWIVAATLNTLAILL